MFLLALVAHFVFWGCLKLDLFLLTFYQWKMIFPWGRCNVSLVRHKWSYTNESWARFCTIYTLAINLGTLLHKIEWQCVQSLTHYCESTYEVNFINWIHNHLPEHLNLYTTQILCYLCLYYIMTHGNCTVHFLQIGQSEVSATSRVT